jgi:hypothetical protein
MFFISKKWRLSKVVLGLILIEFPLIVGLLALTGIASPDLYRTRLWQEGGDQGFNSKPSAILYAYANYRPVNVPLVWSKLYVIFPKALKFYSALANDTCNSNTQYALVLSVLTMFILLCKITMFIVHVWYPIIAFLVHIVLTGLWAAAMYIQTAPDTIDPNHVNHGAPWYITKSCSISSSNKVKGFCEQAKATFALSAVML